MEITSLLSFEASGSRRTAIDQLLVPAGGQLPFERHPEERLYYCLDGRGVMSIYDPAPEGDIYEIRPDTTVYMTPAIGHELFNTGDGPLRMIVFRVIGGVAPSGETLAWTAVSQRGVTVDKPQVGSGVAVTRVFDEGSNPSQMEGQHLRIHDIWLRRPQMLNNAELLTIAPGRSTRLHTHYDTGETSYVLSGEGLFIWDDQEIPCQAGSVISYPLGVMRNVVNTGRFPLTYILIAAYVDEEKS